nr:SEC-C domain-containing protein [Bacillus taeanensis]
MDSMGVRRNDPCFCRSGKKYKKCCMKRAEVVQLQQLREERFEDLKQQFTKQIKEFVSNQISSETMKKIKKDFQDRFQVKMLTNLLNTYFDMWLVYFITFENGKRGVEWFYEENQRYLANDEDQVLKNWMENSPRLLETAAIDENGVMFQDCFTKETFKVSQTKKMEAFAPWQGTIGFIQSFNGVHYIHEVCRFYEPERIRNAKVEINRLMNERNESYKEVIISSYPEILLQLLQHDLKKENETVSIEQFIFSYELSNKEEFLTELFNRNDIIMENWHQNNGVLTWIGDWYCYEDSETAFPVYIAEAFAQLHIKDERLYFDSLSASSSEEFEGWINQFKNVSLLNKEIKKHQIPKQAKALSFSMKANEQTPRSFALFAQSRMLTEDLNEPLNFLNGKTPREMAAAGEVEILDAWLKQHEYNKYVQVKAQFGKVEQTEDVNWMRKELGLPLSPFVTNSKVRNTTFTLFEKVSEAPKNKNDISAEVGTIFKELGFSIEEAEDFYAQDIVEFFKEKTDGKAQSTVKKYCTGLNALVKSLLDYPTECSSWSECSADFWNYLLQYSYLNNNDQVSLNQAKAVLSTVKAFVKWLDERYKTEQVSIFKTVLAQNEQHLYNTIQFFDYYVPFSARRSRAKSAKKGFKVKPELSSFEGKVEGLFKVKQKNGSIIKIETIMNDKADMFEVTIPAEILELVHEEMVVIGSIEEDHSYRWKISDLKRVYLSGARKYM